MPAKFGLFIAAKMVLIAVSIILAFSGRPAQAQGMLSMVDLSSDALSKAEMTRYEVEAGLADLRPGEKLDLTGRL
ncbi:MAG: hypothetical protein K2Q28_13570 [Hyphomicrobium sp.]|nr:hypothetical protein [Hyphomicrobium sp.]